MFLGAAYKEFIEVFPIKLNTHTNKKFEDIYKK